MHLITVLVMLLVQILMVHILVPVIILAITLIVVDACTTMSVTTCPLGHEFSSASTTLKGLHSYPRSALDDGTCTICPGGKYKANTEIERCLICEAGKHSIQLITTLQTWGTGFAL